MKMRLLCVLGVFAFSISSVGAQTLDSKQPVGPFGGSKQLEARLKQLRLEHENFVGELKAIQMLVAAQKGAEASEKLQALIDSRETTFQEEVKALDRQLTYLKRVEARRAGPVQRPSLIGKKAPLLAGKSLTDETVDLKASKGKVIVLEWTSFTCPFSHYHYKTKKTMIELANKYQAQGVVWVAVNSTSTVTPQDYQQFMKGIGLKELPYPVVDDHEGQFGKAFGASHTPQIIIIDKEGKIVYNGSVDNAPNGKTQQKDGKIVNYVDRALTELLAGRRVSTLETEPYGCPIEYAKKELRTNNPNN